jgi:hypothetical protein
VHQAWSPSLDPDLSYAINRWKSASGSLVELKSTTTSLQADLAGANARAKDAYSTGYDDGYSDGQGAVAGDAGSGGCDSNYEGACVPTDYGDVDCGDLLETDFDVVGVDVDGLDGDGDGIACESY